MKYIIITTILISSTFCFPKEYLEKSPRIVGGQDANIVDFPFQLMAEDHTYRTVLCGASLISSAWALTTRTCSDYMQFSEQLLNSSVRIKANMSDLTDTADIVMTSVTRYIDHPEYSTLTGDNDISILQLSPPLECINCKPIPLDSYVPQPGDVITTTGWGWAKTENNIDILPKILQRIDLPVIDSTLCNEMYQVPGIPINDGKFCTADVNDFKKGFCTYDLGGPAVHNGVLVGLMSEAFACEQYPRIQTTVAKYLDWIKEYVGTDVITVKH